MLAKILFILSNEAGDFTDYDEKTEKIIKVYNTVNSRIGRVIFFK